MTAPRQTAKKPVKNTAKKPAKKPARKREAAPKPASPPPAVESPPRDACQKPPGIVCPRCGCADLRENPTEAWFITHTRPQHGFIRRRRVCRHCGHPVFTRERVETPS